MSQAFFVSIFFSIVSIFFSNIWWLYIIPLCEHIIIYVLSHPKFLIMNKIVWYIKIFVHVSCVFRIDT